MGNLEHVIPIHSKDDLGVLAASFNGMTSELQRARQENQSWAETLEDKVSEKTRELRRAHAHLVQMDRMASLGKLSATVAHEINNPLAGILTYARLVDAETAMWAHARRFLEARSIPWIDALPALREALERGAAPYPPDWNGHPNATGNEQIARAVLASGLLAAGR